MNILTNRLLLYSSRLEAGILKRLGKMLALVLVVLLLGVTACKNDGQKFKNTTDSELQSLSAENMVRDVMSSDNAERPFELIDSLLEQKRLTPLKADYYRAAACYYQGNEAKMIEYLERAVNSYNDNDEDAIAYSKTVQSLSDQYLSMNQYEDALRVILPGIAKILKNPFIASNCKGNLLTIIGACQMKLNLKDDAEKNFEHAYQYYKKYTKEGSMDLFGFTGCITNVQNIFNSYNTNETIVEQQKWVDRCDSMLTWYRKQSDPDTAFVDRVEGQLALKRAEILFFQGKKAEADKAFEQFQQTNFSKTDDARVNCIEYLSNTGRYNEAADYFQDFDRMAHEWGMEPNLEFIKDFLFPKFTINYLAGRKDSALAVALKISSLIDDAVMEQKNNAAVELATIYETQEKEAQIIRQQTELSQQRVMGLIIAIISLVIVFIIFTVVRHHAAKRLAEVRSDQERIENELKIARDIQMSMVPSTFPEREGLNMYASMTPAKEVGGDLYGYVLSDDKLYFAVGDVSGKGVPASLFMAQTTQLFRTLAAQKMMPAEICTYMNTALCSDDNESGMFVTFFLGLLDLKTGHLDFCNAEHNPPVIGGGKNKGDFLDMLPNAPFGLWPGLQYKGEEIETIKGRPLFIYTDGLNEAENDQQEQYGDDRLLNMLRQIQFASAPQVIETMAESVHQHRNGAEPNDDLTMMCIKIE